MKLPMDHITIVAIVVITTKMMLFLIMINNIVGMTTVVDAAISSSSSSTLSTLAFINNANTDANNNGGATTNTNNNNPMQQWLQHQLSPMKTKQLEYEFFNNIQKQLQHMKPINIQLDLETIVLPSTGMKDQQLLMKSIKHEEPTPRLPIRNLILDFATTTTSAAVAAATAGITVPTTTTTVEYSTASNMAVTSVITKAKDDIDTTVSTITDMVRKYVPLPGTSSSTTSSGSSSSSSSSGSNPLHIQNAGEYITLHSGIQSLPIATDSSSSSLNQYQSSWEVLWKDPTSSSYSSPFGTIICGFVIDQYISRNSNAVIPPGIMYLSFPIWKSNALLALQDEKLVYDTNSRIYAKERDTALQKMTSTNNLFAKFVHYKAALDAAENYMYLNHLTYRNVPNNINDLIPVVMSVPPTTSTTSNNNNISDDITTSTTAGMETTTTTTTTTVPEYYIVPKGMVRMVPFLNHEVSSSTSSGSTSSRILSLLLSSPTPNNNNNNKKSASTNSYIPGTSSSNTKKDILFGTATIKK